MEKNPVLLNKALVIGIIFLFICISITPSVAVDTIEQCSMTISNGITLYVGGTGPGNYTSIQDAVNDSEYGDTIFIYNDSSPYYENVYVDKSINLIGEDTNTTIVDAGGGNTEIGFAMIVSHANGFSVSNLTLQNVTTIYGTNFAFFSQHSNKMKITNCRIRDSINGMLLQYCANTFMRNNRFENNTMNFGLSGWEQASDFYNYIDTSNTINGKPMYNLVDESSHTPLVLDSIDIGWLGLINCANIVVKNVTITDNLQNILLVNTKDSTITNCKCYNSSQHSIMVCFDSKYNSIEGCPILDGVKFTGKNNFLSNCNLTFGIAFEYAKYNYITNCNIDLTNKKSGVYGNIFISNSRNNTISNCTIHNRSSGEGGLNAVGCILGPFSTWGPGCHYNKFINNTFIDMKWGGIEIGYKCTYNKIVGNRFINCSNENTGAGVYISSLEGTSHNIIYKNTFINNSENAYSESDNYWNNSYPSGGNYWDDYSGDDKFRGPDQNIPGSDCIGDTPNNISGYGNNKDWYPLMYEWGENPPVANFSYILDDFTFLFNASSSYDRDGTIVSYDWDFDDGTNGTGMIIDHVYSENGTYNVTLTVIDDDGKQGNWSQFVRIGNEAPYVPSDPEPPDGTTNVDVNADLSWECNDPDGDDLTYDVYFEANDQSPDELVSNNQSENWYDPGTMDGSTNYFWRIVAWDEYGASTEGPVWEFTTGSEPNDPPYIPRNPNPENESIDVDVDTILRWVGGDPDEGDNVFYDVFLEAYNPEPNMIVADDIIETWFDPGTLEYETIYYWRICAKDNHGAVTMGSVWYFTTENVPESNLDCEGILSWSNVKPGGNVSGNFTVKNIGETGSELDWKIETYPSWGIWTFDPESGDDLPEDGEVNVQVTVVSPDEPSWGFTDEVKLVNMENSSDYEVIAVSLTTPRTRALYHPLLLWFLERFPLLERLLSLIRVI